MPTEGERRSQAARQEASAREDQAMSTAIAFLIGLSIQPYVSFAFEYWLTRPRRLKPFDLFDHCKGCTIK